MLCRPEITVATDRPIWVARSDFDSYVHFQNYMCRDVQEVSNAYFADWFTRPRVGDVPHFLLPPILLENGRIKFISGRHRTAVLAKHLELLPMAVATGAGIDQKLFDRIRHSDLDLSGMIEIPDLPVLSKDELERLVDRSLPRVPTPDPW